MSGFVSFISTNLSLDRVRGGINRSTSYYITLANLFVGYFTVTAPNVSKAGDPPKEDDKGTIGLIVIVSLIIVSLIIAPVSRC